MNNILLLILIVVTVYGLIVPAVLLNLNKTFRPYRFYINIMLKYHEWGEIRKESRSIKHQYKINFLEKKYQIKYKYWNERALNKVLNLNERIWEKYQNAKTREKQHVQKKTMLKYHRTMNIIDNIISKKHVKRSQKFKKRSNIARKLDRWHEEKMSYSERY